MDPNALGPGLFLALVFLAILAVVILLRFIPLGLWITALASGVAQDSQEQQNAQAKHA